MLILNFHKFDAGRDKLLSGLVQSSESVLRDEVGETALEMALETPPFSLDRGKGAVTANVLRVAKPVSRIQGAEPVEQVVKRHWRNGRTVRAGRRVLVSRADFESYLAKTFPKVGYTAGGFEAAASLGGETLPDWIADRNGPGSVEIRVSSSRVEIAFRNEVPWFGNLGVNDRMEQILKGREAALANRLRSMMAKEANAAGF